MAVRAKRLTIWLAIALAFAFAAMAPLSHLAGGIDWNALLPAGAKAAEQTERDTDRQIAQQVFHPAIADPANLSPERADEIYQAIRDQVRDNYAQSGDPLFLEYQTWTRYNRLPYRSPNHGERFVNHFANDIASPYRNFEEAGPLPVGSIVIKDSFTVTGQGQVMTGPLFLMEKMPPGFQSLAGTWRFMMLRPDGAVVGLTGGTNAAAVRFCAECHVKAGPQQDFLYFMPEESRIQ